MAQMHRLVFIRSDPRTRRQKVENGPWHTDLKFVEHWLRHFLNRKIYCRIESEGGSKIVSSAFGAKK
jgi:hypothetical protein